MGQRLELCWKGYTPRTIAARSDLYASFVMRQLFAMLALSLGMIASARSEKYPIFNGSWEVIQTEFSGTTRIFPSRRTACDVGPHMDFEGDTRLWVGTTSLASHTLRGMTKRSDNNFIVDEGPNAFDARVLEIIDVDHIKLTLVNGTVIWLVYCYPGH
jgi:hypothetical protein